MENEVAAIGYQLYTLIMNVYSPSASGCLEFPYCSVRAGLFSHRLLETNGYFSSSPFLHQNALKARVLTIESDCRTFELQLEENTLPNPPSCQFPFLTLYFDSQNTVSLLYFVN